MRYGAATFFTFTYFFCQQSVWHSRCYLVKVHLRRSAVCWLLLRYKGKNCWDLFAAINLLDIVHLLLWCLFLYVCKSDVSGIARVAVNDAQNNLNALKFQCRKILTKKKNNNNIVPKKYHFLCFFTSLLSLFAIQLIHSLFFSSSSSLFSILCIPKWKNIGEKYLYLLLLLLLELISRMEHIFLFYCFFTLWKPALR